MRAIVVRRFGGPESLVLEQRPDPVAGPLQVVVRTGAIGVNPVDTYIRAGTYPRTPDLPYTPGSDAAGVVDAVGAQVGDLVAGDRVYVQGVAQGSGTYAELFVAERWQVHRLPDRLSAQQGAAVGVPYATAYRALFQKAHARPGETVLVHGASGGVGTAAVQLARAAGLRVVGTAGTPAGLAHVLAQGAHHAVDHRQPEALQQVAQVTGGRGVDVIVEMLANVNLDRDLEVLAPRGRVVVVGNRGRVEIDPRKLMSRDGTIAGMTGFNISREEYDEIHAALEAALATGAVTPVVGREMRLAEAAAAHEAILQPGALGKLVLVP